MLFLLQKLMFFLIMFFIAEVRKSGVRESASPQVRSKKGFVETTRWVVSQEFIRTSLMLGKRGASHMTTNKPVVINGTKQWVLNFYLIEINCSSKINLSKQV